MDSVPDPLLASLAAAVAAAPDDLPLRLHYGELLLRAGQPVEALTEAATVVRADPDNAAAQALMAAAAAALAAGPAAPETAAPPQKAAPIPTDALAGAPADNLNTPFDWSEAEKAFEGVVPPMFVDGGDIDGAAAVAPGEVEQAGVRLADVAGMQQVKERLESAFLMPMRNPELRRLYGKSLRGGLLLYGPPGCGKTFIARAVAGELGARFYPVSLVDVLDMYIGESERKLRAIFDTARRNAPCVLFLDEVDAIGHKRTDLRGSGLRSVVQALLSELDGADDSNDGVFVLAATNHPWDVDSALRRPGRFDRMLLVLPPTRRPGALCCACTCAPGRWRTSTSNRSPSAPRATPVPISPMSARPPRSGRWPTASAAVRSAGSARTICRPRSPRSARRPGRGWRSRATSPNSPTKAAPTTTCWPI